MATQVRRELKRSLKTVHLWGIAVGLVISREYFGWSYGWASAGTLGFLVTTLVVAAMYTTFIFSFTELTTAIPHAGGPSRTRDGLSGPAAAILPVSPRWSSSYLRRRRLRWRSAPISPCSFRR